MNPGFVFEGFETFRLFQGKKKGSNPKWLVSNPFFCETFLGNGGEKGREVALFFKLHEAEVIFFSPPFLSKNLKQKKNIMWTIGAIGGL